MKPLLLPSSSPRGRLGESTVTVNEAGSRTPLVYLHGDFAGGMYARALGPLFGPDQPISIVFPHGLEAGSEPSDVEDMAADVVGVIRRLYPTGAIRIAGYSLAGLVALEAARQLQGIRRAVTDVVAIGTTVENVAFRRLDDAARLLTLPKRVRDAMIAAAVETAFPLERFARSRWQHRVRKILHRIGAKRRIVHFDPANEIRDAVQYRRYVQAHKTFVPRLYDGRVTLLWPQDQEVEHGDLRGDWLRVAPAVEFVVVPGNHFGAVKHHMSQIVDVMRERFRT